MHLCWTSLAAATLPPLLGQWGPGSTIMLPQQASTVAAEIDYVYYYIFWTCVIFFVIIVGAGGAFAILYRRTPQRMKATSSATHNTPVELTWSIVPGILLIPMFYWGFQQFIHLKNPPADSYKISVSAQQWNWTFEYANGFQTDELHAPAGRPIELVMNSTDVLHSLYIPDFRVKQDVVPGRITKMWFQAKAPGEHQLFCTEYCGKDHSNMNKRVFIHADMAEFEAWLKNADPFAKIPPEQEEEYFKNPDEYIKAHPEFVKLLPPVETGQLLYRRKGCISCHSVDGKANTGPTWKGLWGQASHPVLMDGREQAVVVDEEYIRESIVNPGAKLSKGFQNVMTPYEGRIKPREIRAIIEYLKELAK